MLRNLDRTHYADSQRTSGIRIVVSWQARLCLNKRWKCYSLCLGNFELGRRYVNICFLTPAKLRSGDYIFKYSLLRPGEAQKRGLFIQIFAFSPRWNSKAGLIHSNICFLAPVRSRSGLNTFTDRHIQIHIKQITRSEILRQYRKITLRVIFISYQSNCQHKKSEYRQSIGIHLYYCANF